MKTRLTGLERHGMSAQDGEILEDLEVLCKDAMNIDDLVKVSLVFSKKTHTILLQGVTSQSVTSPW